MKLKELDVVRLTDGREGTVVDLQQDAQDSIFLIEIEGIDFFDWPHVRASDIASIVWPSSNEPLPRKPQEILTA